MSIIDTLITDRSASDVRRVSEVSARIAAGTATAEEVAEWLGGMRGAYNANDINRVGEAMLYLAQRLTGYGYPITVTPRTDWAYSDEFTPADAEAWLADVAAVRAVLAGGGMPAVPADVEGMTIEEANDIERILVAVETLIDRMVRGFRRSNAPYFWAGHEPLPTAESDTGRDWAALDAMHTTWANWQAAEWYLLLYGTLTKESEVS